MNNASNKCNITIVGGGNSTHTLIPLLSDSGHSVNLLTRKPSEWQKSVKLSYVLQSGEEKSCLIGTLNNKSDRPEEVIPSADVILLSLPVSQYRNALSKIAPFVNQAKKIYIGTIYGQGGFNWMADEIKSKYNLSNMVVFACGLLPWITRTKEYGKVGLNYGPKAVNVAAVSPKEEFDELNQLLLNDLCYRWFHTGQFKQAENFLSLTLSVDNQIIHLSRLYAMHLNYGGKWKNKEDVPLFYRDFDDMSANILRDVDDEYTCIRERIKAIYSSKDFSYMLSYLDLERLSYHSAHTNIKESFTSSCTLSQIPTPTVQTVNGEWVFDRSHRFFADDVYYGLCIAKWMAEQLGIETKTIDLILYWAQDLLGDYIISDGKLVIDSRSNDNKYRYGIPTEYGYNIIEKIID